VHLYNFRFFGFIIKMMSHITTPNKKLFTASIVCISLVLASCQGKTMKSETIIIEPVRVINKALGLSFDLTVEDIKNMGFYRLDRVKGFNGVYDAGAWALFNTKDNWDEKYITFGPLTKIVSSFDVSKSYKFNDKSECAEDMRLISNKLKTKYKSLHEEPKEYSIKGVYEKTLSEGIVKGPVLTYGLGRYVHISCYPMILPNIAKSYSLGVQYVDRERMKAHREEMKQYLKIKSNDLLKKKGINPSQF